MFVPRQSHLSTPTWCYAAPPLQQHRAPAWQPIAPRCASPFPASLATLAIARSKHNNILPRRTADCAPGLLHKRAYCANRLDDVAPDPDHEPKHIDKNAQA